MCITLRRSKSILLFLISLNIIACSADRLPKTGSKSSNSSSSTSYLIGDCNGDGNVTINELELSEDIALRGAPVERCPVADANKDGKVEEIEFLLIKTNETQAFLPNPSKERLFMGPVKGDIFLIGDCDSNGEVDQSELVVIVNIMVGNVEYSSCPAADMNNNGEINSQDSILLSNLPAKFVDNDINNDGLIQANEFVVEIALTGAATYGVYPFILNYY